MPAFLSRLLTHSTSRNLWRLSNVRRPISTLLTPRRILSTESKNLILGCSLTSGLSQSSRRIIGLWLLGCSGMVFGAVTLGGLTRLTESGLSMVDWHILTGMKMPTSDEEWLRQFEHYKQYPEFRYKSLTNGDEMTLSEFKFIWFMEYSHRMWGRTIGVAFFIPAIFFWSRGYFNGAMKKRIGVAGGLLLFQGLLGWYMVKSGLNPDQNSQADIPRVSQYRLTAHLTSAFVLYCVLLWCGLSHTLKPIDYTAVQGIKALRGLAHFSKTAMFCTAVVGGLVAGLDAGLVYNSWPKFADRWVPADLWISRYGLRNITENPVCVQFIHRSLAYITVCAVGATWIVSRRVALAPRTRFVVHSLAAVALAQVGLGIATLVYLVPVWLGSLHQNGSLMLITFAFWLTNEIRRVPK